MIYDYSPRASDQEMIGLQFPTSTPSPDELRVANAQRGRQEPEFRDNEELLRSLVDAVPVMIFMTDSDKRCTYFNQSKLKFAGRTLASILGSGWTEGVHPEDLGRCWDIFTKAFDLREPFEMEFRFRRHDGEYRRLHSSVLPRFDASRSFLGYIGSATDITQRTLAEQSLSKVGKAWIEAQEEEGARVAQELHHYLDRLILLSINLDRYEQNPPESVTDVRPKIGEIRQQVNEIVGGILDLSHHLHVWKLEYLGLARAAESFCKELADTQNAKIDFHSDGVPDELPRNIALNLFRVLQEALQNAIKHSRSQQFEVSLTFSSGRIELTVRDWGIGFDPVVAMNGPGLGLTNMRERLKLADGVLSIESQRQRGTTIRARVPLNAG